jgi:hypothetical protein
VSFDPVEDDDKAELRRQLVNGTPEAVCAFVSDDLVLNRRRLRLHRDRKFADAAPPIAPPPIYGQSPGRSDQPRPKLIGITQPSEPPVGPRKCFLRYVFRVVRLSEHTVGNTYRQGRGLTHPLFEFTLKRVVERHQTTDVQAGRFMHDQLSANGAIGHAVHCPSAGMKTADGVRGDPPGAPQLFSQSPERLAGHLRIIKRRRALLLKGARDVR